MAGVVTHRQHPETAKGAVFVNLEDETGHVNVIFTKGAWARWSKVAGLASALIVRGSLERGQGIVTLWPNTSRRSPSATTVPSSRDWH